MAFGIVNILMRGKIMHYELLTEDISGKKMLDILMPNIIGTSHTFKITAYKGIGRIPPNIRSAADANKRILLDQLPRLLRGYGNTFSKYPSDCRAAVILICDLDNKNYSSFLTELNQVLHLCSPQPRTEFCIAIEEGEAWLLGDCNAIKIAYPSAKNEILEAYRNDSICGTWEVLADAVFPGGSITGTSFFPAFR